jgi:hypothetical protein
MPLNRALSTLGAGGLMPVRRGCRRPDGRGSADSHRAARPGQPRYPGRGYRVRLAHLSSLCQLPQRRLAAGEEGIDRHRQGPRYGIPFNAVYGPGAPVRSGRWATRVRTASRYPVRRERWSPPIGRARASPSARHRCTQRRAVLSLTPNRLATARAERPAATATVTRSLKSCE